MNRDHLITGIVTAAALIAVAAFYGLGHFVGYCTGYSSGWSDGRSFEKDQEDEAGKCNDGCTPPE